MSSLVHDALDYPRWDETYQDLLDLVLSDGRDEQTGAKVGGEPVVARSVFGASVRHDLAGGFPMLGLRKLSWKTVCLETAFFLRGETNANWLRNRGCNIWSKWAAPDGDLGPVYGAQWRRWPEWDDGGIYGDGIEGWIDQVDRALSDLAACLRDPSSRSRRRIIVQAWNPAVLEHQALPPCHTEFQLLPIGGRVNLRFTMRSCDVVTGLPHNVACYALILCMICDAVGATPGEVLAQLTDAHIYVNQIPAAEEMIRRQPWPSPLLSRSASRLSPRELIDHYDPADENPWRLVGYDPHPKLDIGEVAE